MDGTNVPMITGFPYDCCRDCVFLFLDDDVYHCLRSRASCGTNAPEADPIPGCLVDDEDAIGTMEVLFGPSFPASDLYYLATSVLDPYIEGGYGWERDRYVAHGVTVYVAEAMMMDVLEHSWSGDRPMVTWVADGEVVG